jgi:hypothetical protein
MTLQEVCKKYGVAESSMTTKFTRTQQSILKKHGIKIIKEGRGKNVNYREETVSDLRANTMYEEIKQEVVIGNETLKLMSWDFMVFLALVTTPMLVFRGSFEDFLNYVEVKVTDSNITHLKGALSTLEEKNYISYELDRTDYNYFVAAICRKTEQEMQIGIGMIKDCQRLAKKYNKRSWVPILKTWLGVEMLAKTQPYTIKDLQSVTGLSEYQIRESSKILEDSCIFRTTKAYRGFQLCVGTNVDLVAEAFYKI